VPFYAAAQLVNVVAEEVQIEQPGHIEVRPYQTAEHERVVGNVAKGIDSFAGLALAVEQVLARSGHRAALPAKEDRSSVFRAGLDEIRLNGK
jgi:hypothetical protein